MYMHESFADWYQLVSLPFDGAMLTARWSAVETIARQLTVTETPDLVRLFYGRPQSNAVREQLKSVAKAEDPGFLMERGDVELSIMAGGVIAQILRTKPPNLADPVALAVSCMEVQGMRPVSRLQGVVDETVTYLAQQSVRARKEVERPVADLDQTDMKKHLTSVTSNAPTDVPSLWSTVESTLQKMLTLHAQHTNSINTALHELEGRWREESDILWWLFSECTLDGKRLFSDLGIPEACFQGAQDLAELTRVLPGPFAAPAFLKKMLRLVQSRVPDTVRISECVDNCNLNWKQTWVERISVQGLPEICPMLFALSKSVEVGGSADWIAAFETATGLKASQEVPPLDISLQVYNEALLVRALKQ